MQIRPFQGKWRADAGIVLGRRAQRVFEKRRDAEIWLKGQAKIRAEDRLGIRRLSQPREQLAITAFSELDKSGLAEDSILHAVRRFCEIASPGKPTLLSDALAMLEKDLKFTNKSLGYWPQICRQLNRFVKDFPGASLHEITPEQIQEWLELRCSSSAANRFNRRKEIRIFFSKMKEKGLIKENPVDRISKIIVDRPPPEILTVTQVRSALDNLKAEDMALFAVMVFAGLRPSEAEALHWEDIKLDRGFLQAKRGSRPDNRNVRISPNLLEWLKPLVDVGLVFKGHPRRWRDRVQQAIATDAEPLEKWAQDILRHSYASYHMEAFKNAANTAYEMGHRGNPQVLYDHYRELVTPEDAQAFWAITPKKTTENKNVD